MVSLLFVLDGSAAHADAKGDKIIKMMDQSLSRAKDQSFIFDVITEEPGKAQRKMGMNVTIKGEKWRLVEFTSPGDIKGMRVLILSLDQMYIYLPAYHKVRRVAGHARSQSFNGTAFSQDDMSITVFGETYEGKFVSETKDTWKLDLKKRPGKDFPYPRIEMVISKKMHHPLEIYYFNDKGAKLKTEIRSNYKCQGDICNPHTIRMTDHTRNGLWTENRMLSWKFNTNVPDTVFTTRNLQRGN